MPEIANIGTRNIYKLARIAAGITQLETLDKIHIAQRTLARIESGETIPDPEIVLAMEDRYGDTKLSARHCAEVCPIGLKYCNEVEEKDFPLAVIGLITAYNDMKPEIERLICIAADGVITEDEIPEMRIVVHKANRMRQKIESILHIAKEHIPIEQIIRQKENAPQRRAM